MSASFSGCRARARRRFPPTRAGGSSATTSTPGATAVSSISRAAAMPSASASASPRSRRSIAPSASAPSWRTWFSTPRPRIPDYDDRSITENTRACYPIEHIDGATIPCMGGHARHIIFLTCDAFGVLPPVSRLTPAQAMYHFLSGYTAKVAGTEVGVSEPQVTFSACFGAAFLVSTRSAMPRCSPSGSSGIRPARGWSTRAGPAVLTASARGSSWARPARSSTRSTTGRSIRRRPSRTRSSAFKCPPHARAFPRGS